MTVTVDRPLVLVGCGKMGGAMLDGWLKSGITKGGVAIIDPHSGDTYAAPENNVHAYHQASDLPSDLNPQVVILAVKPQMMDAAIADYKRFAGPDCVFISIAAGKTIDYFEKHLGDSAAIVRAMPNTPAAIGQGITVCCPNSKVSDDQLTLSLTLLKAVGEAESVTDEGLIDAVTAVSGGGPAYVFLMTECLAQAGVDAGLPAELSAKLALHTVAGAGQLAISSDEPPAQLRKNVTSPGGTTLEALNVLMRDQDGLQRLMTEAIAAATARSKELAG
ncbi:pyrroline-5-carboxylate reductase [Aestuariispira ectoiniformans]|uniref:pyrroline-5-carboxylate reductase n=1 Tax=Aestuariispira ectoiniformans TaxID=2775080 RepID=UPI00223AE138|nr:pyrroline-5-carboxylate reductase [Aestuariispira ectoiniformans]